MTMPRQHSDNFTCDSLKAPNSCLHAQESDSQKTADLDRAVEEDKRQEEEEGHGKHSCEILHLRFMAFTKYFSNIVITLLRLLFLFRHYYL